MKVAAYPTSAATLPGRPAGDPDARTSSFAELMGDRRSHAPEAKTAEAGMRPAQRPHLGKSDDRDPAAPLTEPSLATALAADGGQILPGPAGGRLALGNPAEGFRFDELGMFGRFAATRAPASGLPAAVGMAAAPERALWRAGAELDVAPMAISAAQSDFPPGEAGLIEAAARRPADLAIGRPGLASAWLSAAIAPAAPAAAGDGAEDARLEPASEPMSDIPEVSAEGSEPIKVVLHDDGDGISLAAAAPLDLADQSRVWRSIKDYADSLGLKLRDFHLNGRAGDSPQSARRAPNGG